MPETDVYWYVHTKANGTLVSSYATNEVGELNTVTRGETATFTLHFPTNDPLIVESGETYTVEAGTTEIVSYVNVKENGTLNTEGTLIRTGGDNLEGLEQYADHAGAFAMLETLNNTQRYEEQIPADADVDSIVLGFEPSQTLKDNGITGIWGLVTSGLDARNLALTNTQYEIEVRVLAEFNEYADHSAVETDLLV